MESSTPTKLVNDFTCDCSCDVQLLPILAFDEYSDTVQRAKNALDAVGPDTGLVNIQPGSCIQTLKAYLDWDNAYAWKSGTVDAAYLSYSLVKAQSLRSHGPSTLATLVETAQRGWALDNCTVREVLANLLRVGDFHGAAGVARFRPGILCELGGRSLHLGAAVFPGSSMHSGLLSDISVAMRYTLTAGAQWPWDTRDTSNESYHEVKADHVLAFLELVKHPAAGELLVTLDDIGHSCSRHSCYRPGWFRLMKKVLDAAENEWAQRVSHGTKSAAPRLARPV